MWIHAFSCVEIFLDFKGNKGTMLCQQSEGQNMKPIKLQPTKTPKGWRLNIPPHLAINGRRQRLFFKSKDLAERHAGPLREKVREGEMERILPPDHARIAQKAISLLGNLPVDSLIEAAREYKNRQDLAAKSEKFAKVWELYIERAKDDNASDRHVKNLTRTGTRFAPLNERLVCEITHKEIDAVLAGTSPAYRNALLREVRAVLNFAVAEEWATANPALKVKMKACEVDEAEIYSPAECGKILSSCANVHPELVPAFVAMLFCGVRPNHDDGEITKLRWEHILLGRENRIALPVEITKTKKRRSVKLRPNAVAWLRWHVANKGNTTGLVVAEKGTPFRNRVREIFETAGVQRIQDGLRKSFCSYVAPIDGLDAAERELGHSGGRDVMNRHYRQDTTEKEARAFWKIAPPKASAKIIPFSKKEAA